jgi:hypothetical protein
MICGQDLLKFSEAIAIIDNGQLFQKLKVFSFIFIDYLLDLGKKTLSTIFLKMEKFIECTSLVIFFKSQ